MSEDVFVQTVATYRSEAGAAEFMAKEERNQGSTRDASCYSLLDGLVLEGMRVLDLGCGFGRDVAALRKKGADAYGCDVSSELLARARESVGPYFAEYDVRRGGDLPFGGGFGMIWCCAVLVHIPREELAAVLKLTWNGLTEGGCAVFISKQGEGQVVSKNLGEELPRVMVFYTVDEVVAAWSELGGYTELVVPNLSMTTYGEQTFGVRLRKV